LIERTGGSWRPAPVDAALRAESVRKVASTSDGGTWIVVMHQLGMTWTIAPFAVVIGTLLLIWNAVLRRRGVR
jgi:hypothetical protein